MNQENHFIYSSQLTKYYGELISCNYEEISSNFQSTEERSKQVAPQTIGGDSEL